MKRGWKRLLAGILTAVMLMTALPIQALAAVGALAGNSAVENAALLQALKDAYGEDAETYLALLEDYGLLDGDGNLVTDEKLTVDGKEYTLDQIEALLDDPNTDLDRVAEVDGQHITLSDLKLIIEIERYLAYIKVTYFTKQGLTDQQTENFYSLADAWSRGQVRFQAAGEGQSPSGIDHDARVTVEANGTASGDTYTLTVSLNENQPAEKPVTFSWRALSGSVPVSGEGEDVTLTAGIPATLEVTINSSELKMNGNGTFYVQLYDLKNALFAENGSDRWEIAVKKTENNLKTYAIVTDLDVSYKGNVYLMGNKKDETGELEYWGYPGLIDKTWAAGVEAKLNQDGHMADRDTINLAEAGYYYYQYSWNKPTMTQDQKNQARNYLSLFNAYMPFNNQVFNDLEFAPAQYVVSVEVDGGKLSIPDGKSGNSRSFYEVFGPFDDYSWNNTTGNWSGQIIGYVASSQRWNSVAGSIYNTPLEDFEDKGFHKIYNNTYGGNSPSQASAWQAADEEADLPAGSVDLGTLDQFSEEFQNSIGFYAYFYVMPRLMIENAMSRVTCVITPEFNIPVSVKVQESTATLNATISAPAGTYYPGQTVPITVEFKKQDGTTYPMVINNSMTLTVNDKPLTPVETGDTSSRCTFLYKVENTDNAELTVTGASLSGTGANQREITVSASEVGNALAGVTLQTPDRKLAFSGFTAALRNNETTQSPELVITAKLDSGSALWVLNELGENDNKLSSLTATVDGKKFYPFSAPADAQELPDTLTAVIPVGYNTESSARTLATELYLVPETGAARDLWFGKLLECQQSPAAGITAENLVPVFTVTPSAGGDGTAYKPGHTVPTVYAQQDNRLTLSIGLQSNESYTWGDTTQVTYFNTDGTPADPNAHFVWKSSDPAVANITVDEKGNVSVTPTGTAGTTSFTVVALNGGLDKSPSEPVGLPDAESEPIEVTFSVGQDPFLMIPDSGKTVPIREGQDAVVNWSSNLCAKNETAGEGGTFVSTTFQVSLYSGGLKDNRPEGQPVWTTELTTTAENKTISSVTIPWGQLKGIYENDERAAVVAVSAKYNGVTYGSYMDEQQNWYNSATATIKMTSQPASVTLHEPDDGLYQTDGESGKNIDLTWDIPNLDLTTEGGGQFELYIAGGDLKEPIVKTQADVGQEVTGSGEEYSYTLEVPAVELTGDPTSYRDSYTITVKAKNAAEATWAYSSYVLHVYSENALQILLDGAAAGGSSTMSNVDKIAGLWGQGGETGSEAIVALQRDIALKNVISINYGEYAWAELADQIKWNSSDSAVASVNYQQGTLYENIENFSYTSYRPATDFILSGLEDGETTITATHVKTKITDSVTVKVETLRDKLYLFQCYPKAETKLTYEVYTDASRTRTEQMTLNTNAEGEAAIYAPYGIAGDVYCQSTVEEGDEKVTYLGTIYNSRLVSSEADSTKLQLYPVNTLQLRRAAYADLYLKKPDGTPYTGTVTFRGGVYRQGELCDMEKVYFGLQDKKPASGNGGLGNKDQTAVVGPDGRLRVTMDISQFLTDSRDYSVEAGEKLYYLFELKAGTGEGIKYYPMLLRVDATLNTKDVTSSGDSIAVWETADKEEPFIASQTLRYSDSPTASQASIRKSRGSVGPSTTFPEAWITTTVMWWGDEQAKAAGRANTVTLRDTTGKTLPSQTSRAMDCPFSDEVYTENVVHLDQSAMDQWGVARYQKRNVEAVLSGDGTNADRTAALPFRVVNMIGAQKAEESSVLGDSMDEMMSGMKGADANDSENKSPMGAGDAMIGLGMSLMAGDAKYSDEQSAIAVRLTATSDPTVFRAFFCLNVGNMESGGNTTGIYPNYSDNENMVFAQAEGAAGPQDFDYLPNAMNLVKMAKGTYMDSMNEEGMDAASGKGVRSFNFDVGGYFEADIAYNDKTGQWECRPISGGFHAGGGLNYSWYVNMFVGPVPVTMSLTLGGSLEISMDMQQGHYYVLGDTSGGTRDKLTYGRDVNYTSEEGRQTYEADLANYIMDESAGNDYLVALRVFLYIRVFAGIGFDYSVIAFKIGVFGQLNVDLNFNWLRRNYLMDRSHISAVGVPSSRWQWVLSGQEPRLSGSTGIQFVFKFLFINYERVFCSVGFEVEGTYGRWEDIEDIWAANKTINNKPVQRLQAADGTILYAVDLGPQLESRDYVDAVEQAWVGGPSFSLFSLHDKDESLVAEALQTGAYSYANPVLSDDGEVMFYLSDRASEDDTEGAKDVTNTRVAVSVKSGGTFKPGTRLDSADGVDVGYGDSAAKLTGTSGGYAAAWVRQMENIVPEDVANGGTLTEGQQMLQMNSTEIVAATSIDGETWALTRLTENSTPDLAPVVATNGERTIVAWREVSSAGADTLTEFDQQDAIRYAIYENDSWQMENGQIAVQTLYDGTGTGASVKGLEMAMLDNDGAAAVVYTLDTGKDAKGNTDWETVAAVIPAATAAGRSGGNMESQDTVRTFQLTSDEDLDENPQIAAVKVGKEEKFVMAWHTQRAVDATGTDTESDIRLAAMDADGVLDETLPESLGRATEGTGETVGSNFRFAKNADSLEDLSILWVDSVAGEISDQKYSELKDAVAGGIQNTGHDVLKAVKLVKTDNSYTLSGAVEVAEIKDKTLIDHFDAYVSDSSGEQIQSVILGTDYTKTVRRSVEISDGTETYTAEIEVSNPITGMYTADARFTNQIALPAVALEYQNLYPNSDIDVQLTIRNTGKDPITKLEIISDGETVYTSTPDNDSPDLNLLPNRDLTVTAQFPTGETIQNAEYTVQAVFKGQTEPVALSDTLYLDIPDVGISRLETVKEADGQRTLRYALYNGLSAKLADNTDGWRVKVGFYADQGCTTPIKDQSNQDLIMTIEDEASLALIDAGGYSAEVTLPVADYAASIDGTQAEISSGGIQVYMKAWVEAPLTDARPAGDQYGPVSEYLTGNNTTSRTLDNLAVRRGEDVTLTSVVDNSGSGTSVTVGVQYNKLTGTKSGNLIVTLLDAGGNPIEKLQSYTGDSGGLLDLSREGTASRTFQFTKKGASVKVEFSDLILNESSAELDHVSVQGAEVTYDPDTNTYTATGAGLTSGLLEIAPKDPKYATITFDGRPYDVKQFTTISLPYGTTAWTITVKNGSKNKNYTLVLNNTDPLSSSGGGISNGTTVMRPITVEKTEHGSVAVSPEEARNGQTVTITAKPDASYQVGKVTVTRPNGVTVRVTSRGDGTYTFVMPNSRVSVDVTFVPDGQWVNPFIDVSDDAWYYDAVKWAVENGITAGTSATTFAPNLGCTRAQVVTFLWRANGSPEADGANPFADVSADAYYYDAVLWAVSEGITAGTSETTFDPELVCSRSQIVTFLYRAAGAPAVSGGTSFTDVDTEAYYADAVTWAVREGVTAGTSATTFGPNDTCTRSQIVTFLYRSGQ